MRVKFGNLEYLTGYMRKAATSHDRVFLDALLNMATFDGLCFAEIYLAREDIRLVRDSVYVSDVVSRTTAVVWFEQMRETHKDFYETRVGIWLR